MKYQNYSRIIVLKLLFLLIIIFFDNYSASSQVWPPVFLNSEGDTIHYEWPPPDSTYVNNELIIYFRPEALHLEKLCFDIDPPAESEKDNKPHTLEFSLSNSQRAYLYNQRFPVDSLIADSTLLGLIKYYGGDTLRRMSVTSPCRDTIAISHIYGDTLRCYQYLYMVLHFNNDTSVINAGINLNILHQDMINWAWLNQIYIAQREPNSQIDDGYENQINFHDNSWDNPMSGFSVAWDYQIGNGVKVAVIDNGIDYHHCDLGGGDYGADEKVYDGWNYENANNNDFYSCSIHGTPVAGIIGAYTNYSGCTTHSGGVAGVAGGWGGPVSEGGEGIGCQLIAMDVHTSTMGECSNEVGNMAFQAILEASTWTPSQGDRFNADIINFSMGTQSLPDLALRDAVNIAYQYGVSFVASAGNHGEQPVQYPTYPAAFDPAWVSNVGASNISKARVEYSNWSNNLDFIAPGGECTGDYYYLYDDFRRSNAESLV